MDVRLIRQHKMAVDGGSLARRRSALAAVAVAVALIAAACAQAPAVKPQAHHAAAPKATPATAPPVGPHGGVNLNVLVVTDGTPAVEAIRQQVATEGIPETVVNLHDSSRPVLTREFLARSLPAGGMGGNFDGIVVPGDTVAGLSAAEQASLAWYERTFGVRQVDAYSPPHPDTGMVSPPVYSGLLSGSVSVTPAGAAAGFGYLNGSFPFSGGVAGQAPFGYLAHPAPGGATPLLTASIPGSSGRGTLVWQYDGGGRQQLGIGFGYGYFQAQSHYLGHGIVTWLTRGVNLGDWRNYLDIAYDDMFLGDAQWSPIGHCTPGGSTCPKGTPMTPVIRMKPDDVTYAVQWEMQHHFTIEFLYNGGASSRFAVHGVDALLVATKPVGKDFYWVNHTWTHAYMGCVQDFSVVPWKCVTSGAQIQWGPANLSLINSQLEKNFTWARQNGIPAEPATVASGEYSGLRLLPQQPVDNPNLVEAMSKDHVHWIVMDASREPSMRPVGAALGVPRHPIDVGYDVDTVANEVNEFNWFNDSKADGGSGLCQGSKVTQCLKPLSPKTGWTSVIVPQQVQIVFDALINNDPRPFFMHQSNLTGDRLGYPVMDGVLSAYRAVYGPSAPIENLPTDKDGAVMRNQQLWAAALKAGTVTAWVQGDTVTISGPPGTPVPLTVPSGSTVASGSDEASPGGPAYGFSYAGERSGFTTLGSRPLTIRLPSAPYLAG
jgi:hypothetical protein